MSRLDTIVFSLGVIMVTVSLTLMGRVHWLLWLLLIGGLIFMAFPLRTSVKEFRYGKFQPTRREIWNMPTDQYRQHLDDKKFTRWVDRIFKSRNSRK